ncbi:MAG TPA: AMIN domain-containing protein, partial [Steroidobacteraceae bacterium]
MRGRVLFHASSWAWIALCGLFAAFASAAPQTIVKDVRLWAGPDSTRVVLDLSGPVEHSVLTLSNPERVAVDLRGARMATAPPKLP